MNEEKFEELMENNEIINEEEWKKTNKNLKKGLRKNIYQRTVKTIIIFCIVAASLIFGLSKIMDYTYFNPLTVGDFEYNEHYELSTSSDNFHILMRSYINLLYPGYSYASISNEIEKKGFGKYELKYAIYDDFEPISYGANQITMTIDKSKITTDNYYPTRLADEFYDSEKNSVEHFNLGSKQYLIEEIKKMPESAEINMSFSFKNRMTMQEFSSFIKQYPNTYVNYCAVTMVGSFPIGFNLVDLEGLSLSNKFIEKYPCMNTNIENKESNFHEIRYHSLLQLMVDNKDFYSNMSDIIPYMCLKEELQRIEKEGVTLIGFKGSVNKIDALQLLESDIIIGAMVRDAKFSRFDY